MELSPYQQTQQLIEKSTSILITTAPIYKNQPIITQIDKVASSLALHYILKELGKKTRVAIKGAKKQFSFLPFCEHIKSNLNAAKDFILSLNTKEKKVKKINYTEEDEKLNIFITPKNGSFISQDLSLKYGPPKHDLIIVLDLADLENLGKNLEKNAELFYEAPIVNIDIKAGNEYFGEVNLVEITSSSCSEIIYKLIKNIWPEKITQDLATLLLSGIIARTNSFQSYSTTPETFKASSELLEKGADKDSIIQNLFKTKNFSLLKLLGRALARIKANTNKKIVWTILTQDDFKKSLSSTKMLDYVFEEFINFNRQSKIHCLFAQIKDNLIEFHIRAQKDFHIENLLEEEEIIQKKNQGNFLYLKGEKISDNILDLQKTTIDHLSSLPVLQEDV